MDIRWDVVARFLPFLLEGVPTTLLLSVAGIGIALVWGLLLALGRLSPNAWFQRPAAAYITFFRGTPLLVQIMLIHYAAPQLFGYHPLPPLTDGILALGLNSSAYVAEIYRAGILSVPRGQMEAARSLGMSYRLAMRLVILPQAFRVAVPPLFNEFIALTKDSSLVFVLGVLELMSRGSVAAGTVYRYLEIWVPVALLYLALTSVFSLLAGAVERRLGLHDQRPQLA
ncbi:MAG: amino acid ABC transporter permease [Clostridia bacterium]|nr:amino acid ABC transporter permease [Clostridia bacterium]MCL6521036.1 amino acid ABC transporter permease [Bacillota bacterium]